MCAHHLHGMPGLCAGVVSLHSLRLRCRLPPAAPSFPPTSGAPSFQRLSCAHGLPAARHALSRAPPPTAPPCSHPHPTPPAALFAKLSATELRSQSGVCSSECTSYSCLKGAPEGQQRADVPNGCPYSAHSNALVDNSTCSLCSTWWVQCLPQHVSPLAQPPAAAGTEAGGGFCSVRCAVSAVRGMSAVLAAPPSVLAMPCGLHCLLPATAMHATAAHQLLNLPCFTPCQCSVAMCPHDNVELRLRPPGIDLW